MSQQDRDTLKAYFDAGSMPTKDHFSDLIDSSVNIVEEGFYRTDAEGFQVRSQVGHEALMSFYCGRGSQKPLWSARFGNNQEFAFHDVRAATARARGAATEPGGDAGEKPPLLTLGSWSGGNKEGRPEPCVGINSAEPHCTLDVNGVVGARGRMGVQAHEGAIALLANGVYQNVSCELRGCQAFEIMAGVGYKERGKGRFALLHAVALNTYNPHWFSIPWLPTRTRIRQQHAFYSRRAHRLQLRWCGTGGRDAAYRLQIRTATNYMEDLENGGKDLPPDKQVRIQVYLTQLWFDADMSRSSPT
jgi:hypothetical protein